MKKERSDKSLVGLAGEYHVLAQFAERGIVGALTLGHTKSVDILAHNPRTGIIRKVEVKTSTLKAGPAKLWHKELAYSWSMSEKHESIADRNLIYCFVQLAGAGNQPKIFIVPAPTVATYVSWEHRTWRDAGRGSGGPNPMRRFRIEVSDPHGYQDNWSLF